VSETFERLDDDAILALQARGLPHLRATNILASDGNGDPAVVAELMNKADLYCNAFALPTGKCICCGEQLTGGKDILNFLGTFTWDIAHGEGYCGKCHYPARAIHRIDGVGTLSGFILQYHPSQLKCAAEPRREDGE
jgi:hypothetical protein